jgi:hypothetical protein
MQVALEQQEQFLLSLEVLVTAVAVATLMT